jgi:hypothetical protein
VAAKKTAPLMRKETIQMKFNEFINNPILKKGLGYAGIVVAGAVAMVNAVADQQKNKEFEELKKTVSELQEK